MSRKTKKTKKRKPHKPSRNNVYVYGASEPITNLQLINDQMRLTGRYYNVLVAIELDRRYEYNKLLLEHDEMLRELVTHEEQLDMQIEAIVASEKQKRIKARKKSGSTLEIKAKLIGLRKRLKKLRETISDRKQTVGKLKSVRVVGNELNDIASTKNKEARAACGLYWGTYQLVEEAVGVKTSEGKNIRKDKPPQYKSWHKVRTHAVSVQIQNGMTFEEAMNCTDTQFRIEPVSDDAWIHPSRGVRKRARKTRVWIRVGSEKNRSPKWAIVPISLHRPIPPEATIMRVSLLREKVGTHMEWRVHILLRHPAPPVPDDVAPDGVIGIDVGWRQLPDGGMRVGYWADSHGNHDVLTLSPEIVKRFRKVDDLQSIRDKNYDAVMIEFRKWVKQTDLPEWLAERLKHIGHWKKANAKLASVILQWRGQRFGGDEMMYELLEAWRQQDKHLYDWERHQLTSVSRRRRELYRIFAATIRKRCRRARVEKLNHDKFKDNPKVEDGDERAKLAKRNHRLAALSTLVLALKTSGMIVEAVEPAYTSKTCSGCHEINYGLNAEQHWTCPSCGAEWDRDHNAAINIMNASGEVVGGPLTPLEASLV